MLLVRLLFIVLYFIVDDSCHCLTFSRHCFTLHVSAYMAIFMCVGYFYFNIPEEICFESFRNMESASIPSGILK
jgi:hypothetical protein